MAQWFRLYETILDDPKVQRLKPDLFKAWVNLLALACRRDGTLPNIEDMAFALRVTEDVATKWLNSLISCGLVDVTGDGWMPHNWASRQFKSDVSAERVKRYRERHRNAECNVTETPSESETDTETESDTEQKVGESGASAPTPTKRGHRLPEDWTVSDAGRAFAAEQGLDADRVAEAFRDYWLAATGATARKLDWDAAYRTWCRRQADNGKPNMRVVQGETWDQRRIREARKAIGL
jgi:hypothetical protein